MRAADRTWIIFPSEDTLNRISSTNPRSDRNSAWILSGKLITTVARGMDLMIAVSSSKDSEVLPLRGNGSTLFAWSCARLETQLGVSGHGGKRTSFSNGPDSELESETARNMNGTIRTAQKRYLIILLSLVSRCVCRSLHSTLMCDAASRLPTSSSPSTASTTGTAPAAKTGGRPRSIRGRRDRR